MKIDYSQKLLPEFVGLVESQKKYLEEMDRAAELIKVIYASGLDDKIDRSNEFTDSEKRLFDYFMHDLEMYKEQKEKLIERINKIYDFIKETR